MRIYKYPLELRSDVQRVPIPAGYRIRAFQMQGDTPTMWAEVNPLAQTVFAIVWVKATGEEVPPPHWVYHGTVQTRGGLVFHLYAKPE